MPSTNKTPFLQLNRWIGGDKPKMEDFNVDNQKVDTALQSHVEDGGHLSQAQKGWVDAPYYIGGYAGDDTYTRSFTLGFQPRLIIVFGSGATLAEYSTSAQFTLSRLCIATPDKASPGITITSTGFTVQNSAGTVPVGATAQRINNSGYNYGFIAFK